jgi:GNAT superfamily N-acetyltransferase
MTFNVRKVRLQEATELARFSEACFRESFGYLFPEEALQSLCTKAFAPAMLEDLVRKGAWVAEGPEGWRGFLTLSTGACPVPGLPEPQVELARLYVASPWQGQGVSDALMEAFLGEVRGRGAKAVWLEAFEGNPRALGFYVRWGFRDLGGHELVREGLRLPHRILGRDLD